MFWVALYTADRYSVIKQCNFQQSLMQMLSVRYLQMLSASVRQTIPEWLIREQILNDSAWTRSSEAIQSKPARCNGKLRQTDSPWMTHSLGMPACVLPLVPSTVRCASFLLSVWLRAALVPRAQNAAATDRPAAAAASMRKRLPW